MLSCGYAGIFVHHGLDFIVSDFFFGMPRSQYAKAWVAELFFPAFSRCQSEVSVLLGYVLIGYDAELRVHVFQIGFWFEELKYLFSIDIL